MKTVAVIGESPNDTTSLCAVWNTKYKDKAIFKDLFKSVRGAKLDSPGKMKRLLQTELKSGKFQVYVYVRDLDGLRSSKSHQDKIDSWFKYVSSVTGGGVLLKNITKLEALIFGDIDTFNSLYKTSIKFNGDPESILDPKKELKSARSQSNKRYHENDCVSLIPKLDFNNVESKCQFYKQFIAELEPAIGIKPNNSIPRKR